MSKRGNVMGAKYVAATIAVATTLALIAGAAGRFAGAEGLSVAYDAAESTDPNGITIERDEKDGRITVVVPEKDRPADEQSEAEGDSQSEADQPEGDGEDASSIRGPRIGKPEGDGEGRRTISGPKIGQPSDADNITYTSADGTIATRARAAFECDLGTFECEDARLNSAWYYVSRSNTIEHRIDVAGDATIVLCPGATLTCKEGIHVPAGSALTVYGLNGTEGTLDANAADIDNVAGIGGNNGEGGGVITICSGTVKATGGEDGAGIGGGDDGCGGKVTIYGGTVKAMSHDLGAGIGGGGDGDGGTIAIHGGTVEAISDPGSYGPGGAGIGGGYEGAGGSITITGGTVDAKVKDPENVAFSSAGIGGGASKGCDAISITGGTVTAMSGCGAGIGGGERGRCDSLRIENATVVASSSSGAAIGGGRYSTAGKVSIVDSDVRAVSHFGAGIGGGGHDVVDVHDEDKYREITISGSSTVVAQSNEGAGIGGGHRGGGDIITITGTPSVDAKSLNGAAIGRGNAGAQDNPGIVRLDNHLKATCYDEGYKLVPAAERAGYCAYRHHVKVEPCEHKAASSYEKCGECHIMHCYSCCESIEQEHDFKEDGSCRCCHYTKPAPSFADATWSCDDGFRVSFPVTVPEDYAERFDDAYCELSIGGNRHRTARVPLADAQDDGCGHKVFSLDVTSIEMGQEVSADFNYDGDERICARASMKDLLARDAKKTGDQLMSGCARHTANLGHYLEAFLSRANGWKVGLDYAEMDLFYEDLLDVAGARAGLAQYEAQVSKEKSQLKGVNASVVFGSRATLDLYLSPAPCVDLGGVATFGGEDIPLEKMGDGRWRARVEGIRPSDFDKPLRIEGDCGGAYSIEVSVLSCANATYGDKEADDVTRQAMASIWQLHQAATDCAKLHE